MKDNHASNLISKFGIDLYALETRGTKMITRKNCECILEKSNEQKNLLKTNKCRFREQMKYKGMELIG